MKHYRLVVLLISLLSMSGCGYVTRTTGMHSRDNVYLSARSIPPVHIPPGMSATGFENQYPIPDRQYPESAKTVSLIPPGLGNN